MHQSKKPNSRLTHGERAERRRQIASFVNSNNSVYNAAKEFGVSLQTVYTACKEHDVQYSTSHTRSGQLTILSDLIKTNLSVTEIARKRGYSKQYVHQIKSQATSLGILK